MEITFPLCSKCTEVTLMIVCECIINNKNVTNILSLFINFNLILESDSAKMMDANDECSSLVVIEHKLQFIFINKMNWYVAKKFFSRERIKFW